MQVCLPMGTRAADEQFCRQFRHLYHRICRLADSVAAYYLCADVRMTIPAALPRDGMPRFVSAAFDGRAARAFERKVERVLARRRYPARLPVPAFCVALGTQFADGGRQTFVYDFAVHSDEAAEAFCRAVCERARRAFRFRLTEHGGG